MFRIPYSSQSPDIWLDRDGGISNLQISGQSQIKRNCHNSRISGDTDMKVELVIKLEKGNKKACQKSVNSLTFV